MNTIVVWTQYNMVSSIHVPLDLLIWRYFYDRCIRLLYTLQSCHLNKLKQLKTCWSCLSMCWSLGWNILLVLRCVFDNYQVGILTRCLDDHNHRSTSYPYHPTRHQLKHRCFSQTISRTVEHLLWTVDSVHSQTE